MRKCLGHSLPSMFDLLLYLPIKSLHLWQKEFSNVPNNDFFRKTVEHCLKEVFVKPAGTIWKGK